MLFIIGPSMYKKLGARHHQRLNSKTDFDFIFRRYKVECLSLEGLGTILINRLLKDKDMYKSPQINSSNSNKYTLPSLVPSLAEI